MSCLPHNNTKVTETHSSISRRHFVQLLLNSHYFLFDTHISKGLFQLYNTSKWDLLPCKQPTLLFRPERLLCSQHGTRNWLIRTLSPLNSTNNKSAKPAMSYTIDHIIDKVRSVPGINLWMKCKQPSTVFLARFLVMAQFSNSYKIGPGYVGQFRDWLRLDDKSSIIRSKQW